jgi:MYXO-CTERM domain-containing protein
MMLRRISSVAGIVVSLGWVQSAHAYCRTSSCELGEDDRALMCVRDEHECVTEGKPLHWPSPCLNYAVQRDGSPKAGIDGDAFQKSVEQTFRAWESVTCPGGGSPRFHAQFQGFVGCARRETVCGGVDKNVNVMMLHDHDWPEVATVIGLTTPSSGTETGVMVDADLEINSRDYDFSAAARSSGAMLLGDVLAHEVGHFLGLSHSDAPGALMSPHYQMLQLGSELLTDDDIAAICAAYPPGEALTCPAPAAPVYDECQVDPSEPSSECRFSSVRHHKSSGCSIGAAGPASHPHGGPTWALLIVAGLAAHRFERRRNVSVPGDFEDDMPGIASWFRARATEDARTTPKRPSKRRATR